MRQLKRVLAVILAIVILVTVCPNSVVAASVKLNKTSVTLYTGQTTTLKVTVFKPETFTMDATMIVGESDELVLSNTTTKKWTSSNENVIIVNSKGKIKALRKGKAVVSCVGADRNIYKCNITVYEQHEHAFECFAGDEDYNYYRCNICGRVTYSYVDKEYTIDLGNGKKTKVVGHIDREMGQEIFNQLNAYRDSKGLPKLKQASDALQSAADIRSVLGY